MERVAIYTAIFGGYDTLREQPAMPGVDFVCFTDNRTLHAPGWRVVHAPRKGHPRMAAKFFKMLPHRVLPRYHQTIWIDGGVQLQRTDFAAVALNAMDDHGLGLFRHPVRDTVQSEAQFCLSVEKCCGQPMLEQVRHYRARGFPDATGLFAGGVLARESGNRRIRQLGRMWLRENVRWSFRDQLSLPFLLWKLRIEPGVVPYNLWDNPLFSMVAHTSER